MSPGFAEEMAEYEDAWQETKPAERTRLPVFTDGTHQAVMTVCRLEEGQYGWQLVLGLVGRDGKTGKPATIRRWENLPPVEEHASFLAADLVTLGFSRTLQTVDGVDYEAARPLAELEEWCVSGAPLGLVCSIYVKTKPGTDRDYTNVYFNGIDGTKVDVDEFLASLGVADGEAAVDQPGTDEDIPF